MSLTSNQLKFLENYLSSRPHTKGKLGGRELSKIKGQYEKYFNERQKLALLIRQMETVSGIELVAEAYNQAMEKIDKRVEVGSDTGDETVFGPAHSDMETVRKECQKRLQERKSEIKTVKNEVEKFANVIAKTLQQSNSEKKSETLQAIKEKLNNWLHTHNLAIDTAQMWPLRERVVDALGGPTSDDLPKAARELEFRAADLVKKVKQADETGLSWITLNLAYELDNQTRRLLDEIDRYLKLAEKLQNGFWIKQFQRTRDQVAQLESIMDPPELVELEKELVTGKQELVIDEVVEEELVNEGFVEESREKEQSTESANLTDLEKTGGEKTEESEKSEPTLIEQAKTSLLKAANLIQLFESEHVRVKKIIEEFGGEVKELAKSTESAKSALSMDFALLDQNLETAKRFFEGANKQLELAQEKNSEAEKAIEGEWKPLIIEIGSAVDLGLRMLGDCEKSTGMIEGGLLYIQRAFESIQSLTKRVVATDEAMLQVVLSKAGLLTACEFPWAKEELKELQKSKELNKSEIAEFEALLDLVKQLMFVSALETEKISSALSKVTGREALDKLIRQFIEGPTLSSLEMTKLLFHCQMICVDADRFFGTQSTFAKTLTDAQEKFKKIQKVAKLDVSKFTIPIIPRPSRSKDGNLVSVGVAIVGGGPIGLMAAVEARMSGAGQVHVYEGRQDAYSRLNVLKIGLPQLQRFRSAGVFDAIFPAGVKEGSDGLASVKSIEMALESRCKGLGIKLERGLFLKNVTRENNVVKLFFQGATDAPKTCDLLIVATGAGVASAQKYADNVKLSDVLGVPFQKSEVKDYAAVGVFKKDSPRSESAKQNPDGWAYDFETEELKYIVTQLTEEEYEDYCENPLKLRERVVGDAAKIKLIKAPEKVERNTTASNVETIDKNQLAAEISQAWDRLFKELGGAQFYGMDVEKDKELVNKAQVRAKESLEKTLALKKKKSETEMVSPEAVEKVVLTFLNMELGLGRFPMEFQQARNFQTKDGAGVLVGDSAATPHPSTAKGLNTGVDEMGSIRDLVEDLEMGQGSEEERKKALQMYEFELKKRTDIMADAAMNTLQYNAKERCTKLYEKFRLLLDEYKDYDHDGLKKKIEGHLAKMKVSPEDAIKDTDWKLREAAVKSIRNFEKQMIVALQEISQLISEESKDEHKSLEALMAPILKVLK